MALFLLHERAKGASSRWAPYLAALPADSGSPVQWSEEDLKELQGSQALQTAMAYRCAACWAGCSCGVADWMGRQLRQLGCLQGGGPCVPCCPCLLACVHGTLSCWNRPLECQAGACI